MRIQFFFFNDTSTTEIYTLSLHDALPIYIELGKDNIDTSNEAISGMQFNDIVTFESNRSRDLECLHDGDHDSRSEEHTSELQSRQYLVCRLLLDKKKHTDYNLMVTTLLIR